MGPTDEEVKTRREWRAELTELRRQVAEKDMLITEQQLMLRELKDAFGCVCTQVSRAGIDAFLELRRLHERFPAADLVNQAYPFSGEIAVKYMVVGHNITTVLVRQADDYYYDKDNAVWRHTGTVCATFCDDPEQAKAACRIPGAARASSP